MKRQNLIQWIYIHLLFPMLLLADGFIIPEPWVNISVKYHRVTVEITDQVAQTTIDQVFLNDTDVDSVEGIYLFPIPENAVISDFKMFIDDEQLNAEVYDANEAIQIYESIVRKNLDPAILEYMGQGLFRARVFPILANGEKRIIISYSELLSYDSEIIRYVYPLSTEKYSSLPLQEVSITISLASTDPLKTIYSPSHTTTIHKENDYKANITYMEENVKPDKDFILYYTVSSDDIGMHILTHKSADEDGFYLFMAAPKISIKESDVIKKRIVFVFDRSGSMSGEKIEQAKEALRFCVNNLNSEDLFNIVDFSSEVCEYKEDPVEANSTNIQEALNYISRFSANGGTNINDALQNTLDDMVKDTFSNMIIFLTDGQPTVGVTDNGSIRQNVQSRNTSQTRLFAFGVGYDVNTHLLDNLTQENHGITSYVRPDENIEVAVSSFFSKINNPVLSNLTLDFVNITVYDAFPKELPDLFKGFQIIELGRYRTNGNTIITLSGDVNNDKQVFQLETSFPNENTNNDFIPRLWATRKVGYLLDQIRFVGENQELIDEVIALSKRYGIITPYTSFLILEDAPPEGNFNGLRDETGQIAFDNAANNNKYRNAENTNQIQSHEVRYIGNKTFYMREDFWVDSEYNNESLVDIVFGSESYFELIRNDIVVANNFAVDKNFIVVVNNTAYKVHEEGKNINIIPQKFQLFQNYPNPFNNGTTIPYRLTDDAHINLIIYNELGHKIKTLFSGYRQTGEYTEHWNGRDAKGHPAPSGIYILKMATGNEVKVKKILLYK